MTNTNPENQNNGPARLVENDPVKAVLASAQPVDGGVAYRSDHYSPSHGNLAQVVPNKPRPTVSAKVASPAIPEVQPKGDKKLTPESERTRLPLFLAGVVVGVVAAGLVILRYVLRRPSKDV